MSTLSVTIFKNIKETATPFYREVGVVLQRIKEGASKDLVKSIRSEKDKPQRNELKKLLPAVCFSGTFTKRNDISLIEHSGLICLTAEGEFYNPYIQANMTVNLTLENFPIGQDIEATPYGYLLD